MFRSLRSAKTTISCKNCRKHLTAQRTCQKVSLVCEDCKRQYELQEYIQEMDEALEKFLESVNCDRI